MSTCRTRKDKGKINPKRLPKGPNGRALCRYCQREVPATRKSFCSKNCVHEWRLRTQPIYLRSCVLKRDDGRCARCSRDTIILSLELQILKRRNPTAWRKWYKRNGISCARRSMWDVHHSLPVSEGGGECGLEGVVTLCVLCHNKATKQLIRKRNRTCK